MVMIPVTLDEVIWDIYNFQIYKKYIPVTISVDEIIIKNYSVELLDYISNKCKYKYNTVLTNDIKYLIVYPYKYISNNINLILNLVNKLFILKLRHSLVDIIGYLKQNNIYITRSEIYYYNINDHFNIKDDIYTLNNYLKLSDIDDFKLEYNKLFNYLYLFKDDIILSNRRIIIEKEYIISNIINDIIFFTNSNNNKVKYWTSDILNCKYTDIKVRKLQYDSK